MSIPISRFFMSLFFIAVLYPGCINLSNHENTGQANLSQQLIDSSEHKLFKASYPIEVQDKESVLQKWVELKISDKKQEWKNVNEGTNIYIIGFTVVRSDSLQTVSYLMNEYENTGSASGNQKVTSFSFRNNQLLDIQQILNFSNNNDIQLTKLLAEQAAKDTLTFDSDMYNESFGLNFLQADGVTLDKEKCKCDGFFYGSNLQCFVIRDHGIGFVFGKYEVGPGSSGTPEILLDWNTLAPYLRPGFVVKPGK
ncbi:MAG: RsiV family protein [Sediminibacterium sp.]